MLMVFVFLFSLDSVKATNCPDGWLAFQGSCYLPGVDAVHFTEAEQYCRQHGAHLVHVESSQENMFLKGYIQSYLKGLNTFVYSSPYHYWIGMTDEIIEGVWKWYGTDTNVPFTDWGPTEPNDFQNEDCAFFSNLIKSQWADIACTHNLKALCEKRGDYCATDTYWIGMTDDLIEGVWKWYGTETIVQFPDCAPTEPQNYNKEDCAVFHMSYEFRWADVACSNNMKALCERRIDPPCETKIIG